MFDGVDIEGVWVVVAAALCIGSAVLACGSSQIRPDTQQVADEPARASTTAEVDFQPLFESCRVGETSNSLTQRRTGERTRFLAIDCDDFMLTVLVQPNDPDREPRRLEFHPRPWTSSESAEVPLFNVEYEAARFEVTPPEEFDTVTGYKVRAYWPDGSITTARCAEIASDGRAPRCRTLASAAAIWRDLVAQRSRLERQCLQQSSLSSCNTLEWEHPGAACLGRWYTWGDGSSSISCDDVDTWLFFEGRGATQLLTEAAERLSSRGDVEPCTIDGVEGACARWRDEHDGKRFQWVRGYVTRRGCLMRLGCKFPVDKGRTEWPDPCTIFEFEGGRLRTE